MEISLVSKIVLGIIGLELLVIIIIYIIYLLMPVEGEVYYRKMEYFTDPTEMNFIIKIKKYKFGYPFSRTCRVGSETYEKLYFGDIYNCQTGEITHETN